MERRAITIRGIVQGVGFRPFVHRLASQRNLSGFVANRMDSVLIEIEGPPSELDTFLDDLIQTGPPQARIERLSSCLLPARGEAGFRIEPSLSEKSGHIRIPADVAICTDCRAELQQPGNRRFRYPFINCTNCGPRLTIITGAPYDRARTTMARFEMCAACRAEYEDPGNRRHHAQAICCPACGPTLALLDRNGLPVSTVAALSDFAAQLRNGAIGAVKGLGGYHLACDAQNQLAVAELRRRKHRDEKPFAVMAGSIAAAEEWCRIDDAERDLLVSARGPIVLLRRRTEQVVSSLTDGVAPGNPNLGVVLPYSPLHELLLQSVGRPLVMTSGNRTDEPIACRDDEAVERLRGIADLFLVHDRPIHVRCDDSVTRIVGGAEQPVRRSRGDAPLPIQLPIECPVPTLAVGGQLKSTFGLADGRDALLSHHLGDLDHLEARLAFEADIARYEQLFACAPRQIVHDLHPDYASTHYAQERAKSEPVRLIAVQHHHAHMASVMADNGLTGPVIGVTFDGAGYGTDGTLWGGEFLVGDYTGFRRAAHLRCIGMPGGERAIREPWRMAAAWLLDADCDRTQWTSRPEDGRLRSIEQMLQRGINSPATSSMGRLFDAVAALAGIRSQVSHEGQAAMELEWLAMESDAKDVFPFGVDSPADSKQSPLVVDPRPMFRSIAAEVARQTDSKVIARRFHSTVVNMIATVCTRIRATSGLNRVVLSGGVFLNALLMTETLTRLRGEGFDVFRHHQVPPNDGGLSLGQLAIAAAMGDNR